jgi:hypothetical protein
MTDERSSSLPDGFTRDAGEINAFEKIAPDTRSKFSKTGIQFDAFVVADSDKSRLAEVDSVVAEVVEGMDPELKKMIGYE